MRKCFSLSSWPVLGISVLVVLVLLAGLLPHGVLAQKVQVAPDHRETAPPYAEVTAGAAEAADSGLPVLAGVSASDITSGSVTLQADLVGLGSAGSAGVLFQYGPTGFGYSTDIREMTAPGLVALAVTELLPGTTYLYRALASSSAGQAFSDSYAFTTLASAQPAPEADSLPAEATPVAAASSQADSATATPPEDATTEATQTKPERTKVRATAAPDRDSEIKSPDQKIRVRIPRGAVPAPVDIEMDDLMPAASGAGMVRLFELNASLAGSGEKVTQFAVDLEVSISHAPGELDGLDLDSLRLYYLDEETRQWVAVPSSRYDREQGVLTATIDHFTNFGEQANPLVSGPGRVMAAQVDLHSGAATFSYPFDLPPGPGGFQTKLALSYNSGAVDEMKNKRDVASWVGTGWTLHPGRISRDPAGGRYFLDFSEGSYALVSTDGISYRTNPDQSFKITRSGNTWEVLDREGVYYRFGGTSDAEQYLPTSDGGYYRWDLNLMRDPDGNEATVSYVQDNKGPLPSGWVRSAYPEYLRYGSIEVHFTSTWDENDPTDGYLRNDNPKSTATNPAPKAMENRRLQSIEIKIGSSLVRKYILGYNTTDRSYSNDYDGIYYAGKHTLVSIAQAGANGTSQLPAMTFTYQDLQTWRSDGWNPTYAGNPGNPASLNWPRLTVVNSGYGGSIGFTYARIPGTSVPNTWTRQVVIARTVDSGMGSIESYTYSYTGDPVYRGTGWDQQYRGFSEVRETDAAGNYVKHRFYTTGTVDGKNAEKLTGREYRTQWFDSQDSMLREKVYDWTWAATSEVPDVPYVWSNGNPEGQLGSAGGIALSGDGYVYVVDGDYIKKFDSSGNFVLRWSDFWWERDVAVDAAGSVYVSTSGWWNDPIAGISKYTSTGGPLGGWGAYGSEAGLFDSPEGIAVDNSGAVYVVDYGNSRVQKFNSSGGFLLTWGNYGFDPGQFRQPWGIATDGVGDVYVVDSGNNRVQKFGPAGNFLLTWGSSGSGDGQFTSPRGIAADSEGSVYVTDAGRVQKFSSTGQFLGKWGIYGGNGQSSAPLDIAISTESAYVTVGPRVVAYTPNWAVRLGQTDEITGTKTARIRYLYDTYGNVITEYLDGDTGTNTDDATVHRVFNPNIAANILSMPARERVYATITGDIEGANLKKETLYYYDGNNSSNSTPPAQGNLIRLEQKTDASSPVSSYYTYDTYGNRLTEQDPLGNITTWTYDTIYHTYPASKAFPVGGLAESYAYESGTTNLLSVTDVNEQTTFYEYDTFKRLTKLIKPGDDTDNPSVRYAYNDWGTINLQHVRTETKIAGVDYLWTREYFDGLGRIVQTQARGEPGRIIISATTTYNNRGLVDRQYVSQDYDSTGVNGYLPPPNTWKYTAYTYDGLARAVARTAADGTIVSHSYASPWQDLVTNERGHKKQYSYDAFGRLVQVQEGEAVVYPSRWGSYGSGAGQFNNPKGIAVDAGGYVYVADEKNHRIKKLDHTGNLVAQWGTYGSADGQLKSPRDVAVSGDGFVYVVDTWNHRIQKFNPDGSFISKWGSNGTNDGQFTWPLGIAVDGQGNVYVSDTENSRIQKFDASGGFLLKWGSYGSGNGQLSSPRGIAVDSSNSVYVADTNNNRIQKFNPDGSYNTRWGARGTGEGQFDHPNSVSVGADGYVYVADTLNNRIQQFDQNGNFLFQWLTDGTPGGRFDNPMDLAVSNDGYLYVTANDSSNSTNHRVQKFKVGDRPVLQWGAYGAAAGMFMYPQGIALDSRGYVYVVDANKHRIQKFNSDGDLALTWGSYGTGNGQFAVVRDVAVTNDDYAMYAVDLENSRIQKFDIEGSFILKWGTPGSADGQFSLPQGVAVDGQGNVYVSDTGNNRIQKFDKDGSFLTKWGTNGTGNGQFNNPRRSGVDVYGNLYVADSDNHRIQKFDKDGNFLLKWGSWGPGNGQFKSPQGVSVGGDGYVYVADTYNHRIQKFDSNGIFLSAWGTLGSGHGQFDNPIDVAVSAGGHIYVTDYDNSNYTSHRVEKFEPGLLVSDTTMDLYATTTYSYDVLGNLVQVVDAAGNTTTMTYDWLSRKTAMADPDMGTWTYAYDGNGSLVSQTDAKGQTIAFSYDALGRLTGKTYPAGLGMTDVSNVYDASAPDNYGKGKLTSMTDALGDASHPTSYRYDNRGRLIEEKRWDYWNSAWTGYTTGYSYDGADRLAAVTYPTGETVSQGYNGRGLPYSLSGSAAGDLTTGLHTKYNGLGMMTEINLGNGLKTTFGYYGTGGSSDTSGGRYGRLWEIKTLPQAGGTALQDVKHGWDATGNLQWRQDLGAGQTEYFTYDFLDRLTSVLGAYTETFTYDQIGNITSKNGVSYAYPGPQQPRPHAVTAVGATGYAYDANGNMTSRGTQAIAWVVENRPVTIGGSSFIYDGDGKRVKKTENGETVLYVNRYYEQNLTTGEVTTYYYLGDSLIAQRKGTSLNYIHQDHLTGTSVMSDGTGVSLGTIRYTPFGSTRSTTGTVSTDKKFTGQRSDGTGLYYYNARYYDPVIGRFISPDTVMVQLQ